MASERRRLLVGTGWTLISTAVSLAVGVALRPLIVSYVGIDGYGVWAAALAIASLFGIFGDLGVSAALTRMVAERRGQGLGSDTVAGSALLLGVVAGGLSGLALGGSSLVLAEFFAFPDFAVLLLIQAVQMPLNLGVGSMMGLLQGHRLFRLLSLFTIMQVVGNLALTASLLVAGLGLPGVMLASLAMSAVLFAALIVRSRNILRFPRAASVVEDAKKLLPFGVKLTATNGLSTILYQIDIVVLSLIVRDPVIIGTYALAVFVTRALWIVPGAVGVTTYPVVSEYSSGRRGARVGEYLSTALVAAVAITGAFASAIVLFGRPLLGLLFGAPAVSAYGLCIVLLGGTGALGTLRSVAPSIPGVGRPDVGMWVSALGASFVLSLSLALTPIWGEWGTAAAVSISLGLVALVLVWAIYRYVLSPIRARWNSRRLLLTASVAVTVTATASLAALPADPDLASVALALGLWAVALAALTIACGGRKTWAGLLERSGTQA